MTLAPIDDDAPSIAVLPFVNMSDDAANEYFADGIAEELLNVLSKIRGLRVASHTSAFSFKGGKVDIATVAQKLNVATILEGSVRKAGNRVRITVQLVKVATDSHAVVGDLRPRAGGHLRGAGRHRAVGGEGVAIVAPGREAGLRHSAAVTGGGARRGEGARGERGGVPALPAGTGPGRSPDTSKRDDRHRVFAASGGPRPGLCVGVGGAGLCPDDRGGNRWLDAVRRGYRRAREAAERALALEPDLAEGHVALGLVRMGNDWDWPGANASVRRALELAPGNADVVLAAASVTRSLAPRRIDRALPASDCARSAQRAAHRYLGIYSLLAGLLEQAEAALKKALELNPLGGIDYIASGRGLSGAGSLSGGARRIREGIA